MKETELAARFVANHPSPQSLYYEVKCPYGDGIIDVVAKTNILVSYEVKTSFSFKLLEQCVRNKKYAHYSYGVIPGGVVNDSSIEVFERFGIGIIIAHSNANEEYVKPVMNRRLSEYKLELHDFQQKNTPGVAHGRVTAFGHMINELKEKLSERGGKLSIAEAFKNQTYYKSEIQLKNNLYQWCRRGVITDFCIKNGQLVFPPRKE